MTDQPCHSCGAVSRRYRQYGNHSEYSRLVCGPCKTLVQPAQLDFRACLVFAVCHDGAEFLAGVVAPAIPRRSECLFAANGAERVLVSGFFRHA